MSARSTVYLLALTLALGCGPDRRGRASGGGGGGRGSGGRDSGTEGEGPAEGEGEGPAEGEGEGPAEGEGEGAAEGEGEGAAEGEGEGPAEGEGEGPAEGEGEGPAEGEGEAVGPSGPHVDPDCPDGQYREVLPSSDAAIGDLTRGYRAADYMDFVQDVLERRYPIGWYIVEGGLEHGAMDNCVEAFLYDRGSAGAVVQQLSTVVHECGHMFDLGVGGFANATYVFTPDRRITCISGDTRERGGRTFARSRLNGDEYSDLRPPCEGGFGRGCDHYANTYLDGDPDDGRFEGGDQGFNSVLEETVQYVNSLATGYAFHDQYQYGISDRDGILTFLWYVERFLRMARLDYPDAYALLASQCWREAILTTWGRAWLFLEQTERMESLGIEDDILLELVTDPELRTAARSRGGGLPELPELQEQPEAQLACRDERHHAEDAAQRGRRGPARAPGGAGEPAERDRDPEDGQAPEVERAAPGHVGAERRRRVEQDVDRGDGGRPLRVRPAGGHQDGAEQDAAAEAQHGGHAAHRCPDDQGGQPGACVHGPLPLPGPGQEHPQGQRGQGEGQKPPEDARVERHRRPCDGPGEASGEERPGEPGVEVAPAQELGEADGRDHAVEAPGDGPEGLRVGVDQ